MRMKRLILLIIAAGALASARGRTFVHPGIFYTQGDFDRMKAMVAAGKEPWKRGYEALRTGRYSSKDALVRERGGEIGEGKFNGTIGIDGRHAHDLALMWRLTGDEAYAAKAREFLVQNSKWTGTSWAGTGPLDNGKIYLLVEAAEMLRDWPGWTQEEQREFGRMLRDVFVPHIYSGDVMRWGNQGLTAWRGLQAIAIFLDDDKLYDRVWNYITGRPHRPDDEPYPAGGVYKPDWPANYGEYCIERTKPPTYGTEPDWGYDDQLAHYLYPNGQCEETCRDQSHTMYGLFQMAALAEVFWNQGDDLYGALDDRILLGIEWSLRYNMSDWEPKGFAEDPEKVTFDNELFLQTRTRNNRWSSVKPSPHGRGTDGGPGAPKTAVLMHYVVRKGVEKTKIAWLAKAVKRQLENDGFESWGAAPNWYYEWEGWGTLTKMRTKYQAGDPGTWRNGARISGAHKVPCAIRAVDYDFSPIGKTSYYPGKAPQSEYRTDATLPMKNIKGKWCLNNLKKGEWADWTLSVAEEGDYNITIYAQNSAKAKFSFFVDGKPMNGTRVHLPAGAPVLRLMVDEPGGAVIYAIKVVRG